MIVLFRLVSFWVFGYGSVGMVIDYSIVVILLLACMLCWDLNMRE